MNIVFVTRYPWSLQYGGAEIQADYYCKYIQRYEGWSAQFIDFYSRDMPGDIVHIIGLNAETEPIVRAAKRLGKRVTISPIYYLDSLTERRVYLLGRLSRWNASSLKRYRSALLLADAILPNSGAEADQLAKIFALPREAFHIIWNGVDEDYFDKNFAQTKSPVEGEYILNVAMIEERKNTLRLIEAYIEAGLEQKLVIVGDYRSSNPRYVEKVADRIGKHPNIVHLPFQTEKRVLASLYGKARLYVLPSILETPGLSTLEAMACGTTAVVGRCNPVSEYFGESVLYVDPFDIDNIARVMQDAVKKPNREANNMAAVSKYRWGAIVDELKNVYQSL